MRFVDVGGRIDTERLTGRYTEPPKQVFAWYRSKEPAPHVCVRARLGR